MSRPGDVDVCSEGESGVFVNSDGFSPFHAAPPAEAGWPLTFQGPDAAAETETDADTCCRGGGGDGASHRTSIVDRLLVELYDTYTRSSSRSVDSLDSSTEASSSDAFLGRSNSGSNFLLELQEKHTRRHQMNYLSQKDPEDLKWIEQEVNYRIGVQSAKLVRQLKRKDRLCSKQQKNCDIITACLQAVSPKRSKYEPPFFPYI